MGVQMACSYVGSMVIPRCLAFWPTFFDVRILPAYLLLFLALMFLGTESILRAAGQSGKQ